MTLEPVGEGERQFLLILKVEVESNQNRGDNLIIVQTQVNAFAELQSFSERLELLRPDEVASFNAELIGRRSNVGERLDRMVVKLHLDGILLIIRHIGRHIKVGRRDVKRQRSALISNDLFVVYLVNIILEVVQRAGQRNQTARCGFFADFHFAAVQAEHKLVAGLVFQSTTDN